ncbi:hypothetical protein [Dermabacter hominis]|uniref:hypothetical protein n=1 Tax=Dermabacter hominis TaxID=36740 RepID=UPI0021A8771C|nr:hypothetical protein [Dermabacter hominis]MCT1790587.1 hypothetical protein [Dermabacter hominis]
MKRHANNREPSTENTAHTPSSFEENLATAIRQAATHIREALTRNPEDFKNSLDLTK